MKDYHGLIFSRNGRLIDVQARTPWTTFVNNDRYIKVEVGFPATLDELFGVTTSKQQVTVSPVVWNLLRQAGMPKAIEQLRMKVREAKVARRAQTLAGGAGLRSISERTMMGLAAPADGLPLGNRSDAGIRTAPFRTELVHAPADPFFRLSRDGRGRVLHVNTSHRFYQQVYDAPAATPYLRAAFETMLFSLGDVSLELPPGHRQLLLTQIDRWSRRLDDALRVLSTGPRDVGRQGCGEAPLGE
jgi:hypothetical protein